MTMPMASVCYRPIGIVHSPFREIGQMPVQPVSAAGVSGTIELLPDLVPGLQDLDGFSHLLVIYHFHRSGPTRLSVTPFLDDHPHGIFATRAPVRPNPIGLSLLTLLGIDGHRLQVGNLDILDGTPVLDIKPYVPQFDQVADVRSGWVERAGNKVGTLRSDDRFGAERD